MVKLSKGNSKLGKVLNVSLPPIASCQKNVPCVKKCYAMKSYRLYPSVRNAWDLNFGYYLSNSRAYFESIEVQLENYKGKYFRWHVSGDIPDQTYLDGMFDLARKFPQINFLCYTKNYKLDFDGKPENLRLVISAWKGLRLPKKLAENMPVAWISSDKRRTSTDKGKKAIACKDSCQQCGMLCYKQGNRNDVVFNLH